MKKIVLMMGTVLLSVAVSHATIGINPRGAYGESNYWELYGSFAQVVALPVSSGTTFDSLSYSGSCDITYSSAGQINIAVPFGQQCSVTDTMTVFSDCAPVNDLCVISRNPQFYPAGTTTYTFP